MRALISVLLILLNSVAFASVETLIIDTGAGHASVTRFPNGDIMVFDTGHWTLDIPLHEQFEAFIGDDADIDLLIASHTDADHIGATHELFNNYRVHRVIRTGLIRDTGTWQEHNQAINDAASSGLTHEIDLADTTLPHGTSFEFGGAIVTYLAGFHEPPPEWGLEGSEFLNGGSVVVRVSFKDNSILFTGDAVGRHEGSDQDSPAIATERLLIDHASQRPIQADVLIAPHHGSDDANSTEFIQAVAPRWVIFPAGSNHAHPRKVTAKRYTDLGYTSECLLRTDLGDDEGDKEWNFGRINGHKDTHRDDAIGITLPDSGEPVVRYIGKSAVVCPTVISASTTPPVNTGVIKKSRSGICYSPGSSWYTRTKNFDPFDDLASCLGSGGRLPN